MNIDRVLTVTSLVAIVTFNLTSSLAAQKSQDQLKAQRAAKLKKPFLANANWYLDYDKARAEAKKQKKWILTYFTRSYAH